MKINELKKICNEEDIFLKLELDYKILMRKDKEESFEYTNEFFYTIMPEDSEKVNIITYMIELDSRIIGKIRVELNGKKGLICGFRILPEYRNQGYGKQALKSVLNILYENKIYDISLEVETKNKNALKLYKSYGFVEESVTDYYEVVKII